jgi:tetratricopeptide (TPR) repeat protein
MFVPNFTEAYQGMLRNYTALNQPEYAAYARGMIAFSQKDYPAALNELNQAVQKLPKYVPAYIGLGITNEQLGQMDAARAALEKAVEIAPENFTATQALGRVKVKQGGK